MAEKETHGDESSEPKKSKLPLIIIIVLLVVILVGGGIAAFLMLGGGHGGDANATAATAHEESADHGADEGDHKKAKKEHGKGDPTEIGPMFPMTQFIVNLMSDSGQRYLKTTMSLELSAPEMAEEVEKKKDPIRNIVLNVLTSKTYEDISNPKGKDDLRLEIIDKVNEIMKDGEIKNVYFTDFVVQ